LRLWKREWQEVMKRSDWKKKDDFKRSNDWKASKWELVKWRENE
jgi:hypothetical protein